MMHTKDRLVAALTEAGAPKVMITAAAAGCYDDFESESATPQHDLVRDCMDRGLTELARRAMDGEFDGTKEEAEA